VSSSSRPRLAWLATDRLARDRRALKAPPRSAEADAIAIDAIAKAITSNAKKRKSRFLGVGLMASVGAAAAAALIAGVVFGRRSDGEAQIRSQGQSRPITARAPAVVSGVARSLYANGGGAILVHDGREAPIGAADALARGDHVVVRASGSAAVDLSTGTRFTLEQGADVAIAELGPLQSFTLVAGRLRADVAKLGDGQRFVVQTPDAEIEVRGTSFHVESGLAPCAGSTTRVRVTEGTVAVRSARGEDHVHAGGDWPNGCAAMTTMAAAPRAPASAEVTAGASPAARGAAPGPIKHRDSSPATTTAPTLTSTPTQAPASILGGGTSSELAEQNRLYGDASAARRRGATSEAVAAYERFLARYPSSQLAESASVERMRLLASTDRSHAASAARDYLARWPRGFARDEAMSLAEKTKH
jgi:hypothetical protein